jgi:hypothetical protein
LRTERTLVNGEAWLPSRWDVNLRRSIGIGKLRLTLSSSQASDYQRFGVDSDLRFTLPAATP